MSKNDSYFDGGLAQYLGWKFLGIIITFFTLGLCMPWAYCMIYKWEASHTVINGRRLKFSGSAVELFWNYLKWIFLSIITLGIYSFWITIKLKQWTTKNTSFVN